MHMKQLIALFTGKGIFSLYVLQGTFESCVQKRNLTFQYCPLTLSKRRL